MNGVAVEDKSTHTCALCVALNDTVFRNNNKPKYYHPKCKCELRPYNLTDVIIDLPMKKITNYLFVNVDKKAMMRSMGFIIDDSDELYKIIETETKKQYLSGNYVLKNLNENGQHFKINITLKGKREYLGESYKCHIGTIMYPYGKIKIATPIIKD